MRPGHTRWAEIGLPVGATNINDTYDVGMDNRNDAASGLAAMCGDMILRATISPKDTRRARNPR